MAGKEPGLEFTIDPLEWYRFKKKLDQVDPEIARALRRRIRNAGNVGAAAVRAELAKPTPGGTPLGSDAGRQALIDATRVSVSFTKASAGARIITTAALLPDSQKGLLKVYNKRVFRHPVFERSAQGAVRSFSEGVSKREIRRLSAAGDLAPWVTQVGHPYFGRAIYKVMHGALTQEIRNAFYDAAKAAGLDAD